MELDFQTSTMKRPLLIQANHRPATNLVNVLRYSLMTFLATSQGRCFFTFLRNAFTLCYFQNLYFSSEKLGDDTQIKASQEAHQEEDQTQGSIVK